MTGEPLQFKKIFILTFLSHWSKKRIISQTTRTPPSSHWFIRLFSIWLLFSPTSIDHHLCSMSFVRISSLNHWCLYSKDVTQDSLRCTLQQKTSKRQFRLFLPNSPHPKRMSRHSLLLSRLALSTKNWWPVWSRIKWRKREAKKKLGRMRTVGDKRHSPVGHPWNRLFHLECNVEIDDSHPACTSTGKTNKSTAFFQSHFEIKQSDQSKKLLNSWSKSSAIQIRTLPNPHGWPTGYDPSSSPHSCTWADPVGWSCRKGPINNAS